jgi:hypothetical protein
MWLINAVLTIYFLVCITFDITALKQAETIQDINYHILSAVFEMFAIALLWGLYGIGMFDNFFSKVQMTTYTKNEQKSNGVGDSTERTETEVRNGGNNQM